jgi:hypothetical protein
MLIKMVRSGKSENSFYDDHKRINVKYDVLILPSFYWDDVIVFIGLLIFLNKG